MSIFSEAAARAAAAIGATHGERLRHVPIAAGNRFGPARPDESRAVRELNGAVIASPKRTRVSDNAAGRDFDTKIATTSVALVMEIEALKVDGAIVDIATGDIIKRLDEPGEPEFTVAAKDTLGSSALIYWLAKG